MHEMIGRRTSFEAVLDGFDSDAPPQWRLKGCSLPYGRLQGFIEATTAELPKQQAVHSGQTDFFSELRREVLLIDRCVVSEAQRILREFERSAKPRFGALRSLICPGMESQQRAKLANDISWCQQYAAINRIGLQRLVEQHDRCHDSSAGADFLKECQRPGASVGTFLKTPLLHKVQELQRSLVGVTVDKDQGVLGVLTSRQHSSSGSLPKGRGSIPVSPFKAGWPAGADIKAARHSTSGPIPAL